MPLKLSIGDFSRMTHLTVKALRHYQEVGLLSPSAVDSASGYRSYDLSQVPAAQVIRRFRDLGMPVEQIKGVLSTTDVAERNRLIVNHLKHMEAQLERTQGIVASLRTILEPTSPLAVEYRSVPAQRVAAVAKIVDLPNIEPWWSDSFAAIHNALRQQAIRPAGPQGGLYPTELYTDEVGEVTLFVPIPQAMAPSENIVIRELPPTEYAVALHRGSLREADRTYATLGAHVLENMIAGTGSIRENYIITEDDTSSESRLETEICWPIFRARVRRALF
jgi:DNA-binding transcriptional MerR regulator